MLLKFSLLQEELRMVSTCDFLEALAFGPINERWTASIHGCSDELDFTLVITQNCRSRIDAIYMASATLIGVLLNLREAVNDPAGLQLNLQNHGSDIIPALEDEGVRIIRCDSYR